jgi:hypothetical protein
MYGHELRTIKCSLKQEYVWFRGGDINGFRDIWALPVKGGWDHTVWS